MVFLLSTHLCAWLNWGRGHHAVSGVEGKPQLHTQWWMLPRRAHSEKQCGRGKSSGS